MTNNDNTTATTATARSLPRGWYRYGSGSKTRYSITHDRYSAIVDVVVDDRGRQSFRALGSSYSDFGALHSALEADHRGRDPR